MSEPLKSIEDAINLIVSYADLVQRVYEILLEWPTEIPPMDDDRGPPVVVWRRDKFIFSIPTVENDDGYGTLDVVE